MADIVTPQLGESVSEATVAKWAKKAGDAVKKDEVLVELETDKVSLEVAAPSDGVLGEIVAQEGATVVPGAKLGVVSEGGAAAPSKANGKAPAAAAAPSGEEQPEPVKGQAPPAPAAPVPDTSTPSQTGAAPTASGSGAPVTVPAMGESVTEGTVATWSKKVGDAVKKDEILVEIETDKVALEVASPADGVLSEVLAKPGDTVKPNQVIARIGGAGAGAGSAVSQPSGAGEQTPANQPPAAQKGPPSTLSPSVQRIVSETGIDPSQIAGTGRDGRITKGDALAASQGPAAQAPAAPSAEAKASPAPAPQPSAPQPSTPRADQPQEERVRMTRLRQTIARRLKDAQNTAAMLTTFNEVDMKAVMDLRTQYKDVFEKRHGVKLGFMSLFTKAVVAALKEVPAVNAEIDGTDLIYKNHYDIGVAVGTDKGLVVPVLRGADRMSLAEIEKAIAALGKKARDGALAIEDLSGGTFTITNGGIYGSLMSTPILNMPQAGILGMHNIVQRPVAVDGKVEIRPMMYLAVSYDHRIVDGKEAVTFLVAVKNAIEDPHRLLLDL